MEPGHPENLDVFLFVKYLFSSSTIVDELSCLQHFPLHSDL